MKTETEVLYRCLDEVIHNPESRQSLIIRIRLDLKKAVEAANIIKQNAKRLSKTDTELQRT